LSFIIVRTGGKAVSDFIDLGDDRSVVAAPAEVLSRERSRSETSVWTLR